MTNIVKANQLTKTFGKVKALDHCDLEIKKERSSDTWDPPGQARRLPLSSSPGSFTVTVGK